MNDLDHYDKILSLISPHTTGVFWIEDKGLDKSSVRVRVFNYLLDGQLDNFLEHSKKNSLSLEFKTNFFITKNFDSTIIISNFNASSVLSKEDLDSLEVLINKMNERVDKNILFIHPKKFKMPQIIKNRQFNITSYTF